ncbi:LOW QUALITY PROTEIN: MICAL-like protein 1 [Pholidichthys leucotaenia]
MASPRALLDWCHRACASYPGVEIKDLSASFRDGLAFCAIIHKHRPDLIDFSSLSKDDMYQNNKLAFEVAETKLGIPALLEPKDMVSTKLPDCLSVTTYLSQYYCFFSGHSWGPAQSQSSHVGLAKSKATCRLKHKQSSTNLETGQEVTFSDIRPQTLCSLCLKPVHLIQRYLIEGKVYHRSCFRCKVCHSTLLPLFYTQGSDPGSLICSYHTTESKSNLQTESTTNQSKFKVHSGYYSLEGLPITRIPCYTKKADTQDRQACKTEELDKLEKKEGNREVRDRENETSSDGIPQPGIKESPAPTRAHTSCARVTEGSTRPVPAPRQMLNPSVVPVPAPRIKTSHTMNTSLAVGSSCSQSKSPASPSNITSPKGKSKHPWLNLVHPGPWTQLPPAPAPIPNRWSKSVSNLHLPLNRPRFSAPNPFEEEDEEDIQGKATDQTKPSVASTLSENHGGTDAKNHDFKEARGPSGPAKKETAVKVVGTATEQARGGGQNGSLDKTETEAAAVCPVPDATRSSILPRSLSVPAITETDVTASKVACKENSFDRKSAIPKSQTFQGLSSSRGTAPGHGFPLIKRKVQTDQHVSTEELQAQRRELDKHLEALEQRGVEVERNLRGGKKDKAEEQILIEWFSLTHERHVVLCQDKELVYPDEQQKLEDRQADVEYARCLFNKPESDWTKEDRSREQQLMDELVAIIEQRNQIISSLDQDRQREKENGMSGESMTKKDFQKEQLKELKKSKGKFKPTKVLKY